MIAVFTGIIAYKQSPKLTSVAVAALLFVLYGDSLLGLVGFAYAAVANLPHGETLLALIFLLLVAVVIWILYITAMRAWKAFKRGTLKQDFKEWVREQRESFQPIPPADR
jgi:hypothetical protein